MRRAQRKRARRNRIKRDREVTREHGDAAHRSCGRKARYPTEGDALALARKFEALGAPALRAYKCRYCGGWHLTKTEKRTKAPRRAGRGEEACMEHAQGHGADAVPEVTARAAAINARLGMEAADIARSLSIGVGEVEAAVARYAHVSDGELGIPRCVTQDDEAERVTRGHDTSGARGATVLRGRYWLVMASDGTPVALCGTRGTAAAASKAVNRALKAAGTDALTHVESVEAWEVADDGD